MLAKNSKLSLVLLFIFLLISNRLVTAQNIIPCADSDNPRSPLVYSFNTGPLSICPVASSESDAIICFNKSLFPDINSSSPFTQLEPSPDETLVRLCYEDARWVLLHCNTENYVAVSAEISQVVQKGRVLLKVNSDIGNPVNNLVELFFGPALSRENPVFIDSGKELVLGNNGVVISGMVFGETPTTFLTVCEFKNGQVSDIGLAARLDSSDECMPSGSMQTESVARKLTLIEDSLNTPGRTVTLFLSDSDTCSLESAVSNMFNVTIRNMSTPEPPPDPTSDGVTIGAIAGAIGGLIIVLVVVILVFVPIGCYVHKRRNRLRGIGVGGGGAQVQDAVELERRGTGESYRSTGPATEHTDTPGKEHSGSLYDSGVDSTPPTPNKKNSICVVCENPDDSWYKEIKGFLCQRFGATPKSFNVDEDNDYSLETTISDVLSNVDHLIVIGKSTEGQPKTLFSRVVQSVTSSLYHGLDKICVVRLGVEQFLEQNGLLCIPTDPWPDAEAMAKTIYDKLTPLPKMSSCPPRQFPQSEAKCTPKETRTDPTHRKPSALPAHVLNDLGSDSTSSLKEAIAKIDAKVDAIGQDVRAVGQNVTAVGQNVTAVGQDVRSDVRAVGQDVRAGNDASENRDNQLHAAVEVQGETIQRNNEDRVNQNQDILYRLDQATVKKDPTPTPKADDT